MALLETFQAVRRSLGPVVVAHGITTAGEVDNLLGELENAKGAEYIGSFANLYVEMIAQVP